MKKNLRTSALVLTTALLSSALLGPVLAQTATPPATPPVAPVTPPATPPTTPPADPATPATPATRTTPAAATDPSSAVLEGLREYKCADDLTVSVQYGPDFVDLTFKDETFTLEQKTSASGLQYVNTDEKLTWYSKGDEGYLEKDGKKIADACKVVPEDATTTTTTMSNTATTPPAATTPSVPVPADATPPPTTPPATTPPVTTPPADPATPTAPVTPPAGPANPVTPPADLATPVTPAAPVTPPADPATPVTPPADLATPVTPPAAPATPATPTATPATPAPDAAPLDLSTLEGTTWSLYYLTAAGKTQAVAGTERPTLSIAGGKLNANTGCNEASSTLTAEGARVTVGALTSTKKACTDPAAQQLETDLLVALEGTHTPTVRDYTGGLATLTLRKDDGTFLVLVKKP